MKFHEWLAKKEGITIEEAAHRSLARTWELSKSGKVLSLITAFVRALPYEQNVERNDNLARDIRANKFGYTPIYGYWAYKDEKLKEDAFLVSAPQSMPNQEFHDIVLSWIKKYDQEAAVVKYADSNIARLLHANGQEINLGIWQINRLAEIYSQMKAGPENRTFVFEAADDHSWSTRLAMSKS